MIYDNLLREAEHHGIDIYELPMRPTIKGLYYDKSICLNKNITSRTEKGCVLAEELGHYHTSSGNIIDLTDIRNRKQEQRARSWAYERLVPLAAFIDAHRTGIRNRYELADYLGVTEDFLAAAINRYQEKYGIHKVVGNYTIVFEPLGVLELFE